MWRFSLALRGHSQPASQPARWGYMFRAALLIHSNERAADVFMYGNSSEGKTSAPSPRR